MPEARAVADRLAELTGIDVLRELEALGELVDDVVPGCVGVSLTVVVDGDAFTLTSTGEPASVLDAVQYLDGDAPCLRTAVTGGPTSVPDVLDEGRWQAYRLASTAEGVRSSLSLPVPGPDGSTAGAVNVYSSVPDAFAESADILAAALQVPMDHLVTNADLPFRTREDARELPALLAARARTDLAVGLLAGLHSWDAGEARRRLRESAADAGLPVERLADLVVDLYGR